MRTSCKWLLLCLLIVDTVACAAPSSAAAAQAVSDATGAALQANAARAIQRLDEVPAGEFSGDDRAFRKCMLERFGRTSKTPRVPKLKDSFARKTLAAYQAYWYAALLQPSARDNAEVKLRAALQRLLDLGDLADMDAIEPVLAERLQKSGYYSLQGLTGPLRELMLWSKQENRQVRVDLPEGAHTTTVMVLDDFASLGWSAFATCERRSTGGWATSDALFAVRPRYASMEGEEFRVSFLGHETQHFADFKRFPGLASWELEYRAKLTELALADTSRAKVLRKFTEDQGDDPESPHAYANKRVLSALGKRLGLSPGIALDTVEVSRLQAAAVEELRQDSARREASAPVSR